VIGYRWYGNVVGVALASLGALEYAGPHIADRQSPCGADACRPGSLGVPPI
jgi:hypothetical protein